jgi:hypothetical protein
MQNQNWTVLESLITYNSPPTSTAFRCGLRSKAVTSCLAPATDAIPSIDSTNRFTLAPDEPEGVPNVIRPSRLDFVTSLVFCPRLDLTGVFELLSLPILLATFGTDGVPIKRNNTCFTIGKQARVVNIH